MKTIGKNFNNENKRFDQDEMMDFDPGLCRNEREVESKLIVHHLLPKLGYSPETWHQELACGSIRLDFLAFAANYMPFIMDGGSPLSLVIEAKHPKENLDHHVRKLCHYLTSLRVRYGMLTNAKELRIYKRIQSEIKLVFCCPGEKIFSNLDRIRELIGRSDMREKTSSEQEDTEQKTASDENISDNQEKTDSQDSQENAESRQPARAIPRKPNSGSGANAEEEQSEEKGKHNMKVIAVYHNKGGVGKTTTVVNLAAALSKRGQRVLVIDLDSQANTTFATGLVKFLDEADDNIKDCNVGHVLEGEDFAGISEISKMSFFAEPEIDVVPSHINLMDKETDLDKRREAEFILIDKLAAVSDKYDVVLIDTPPSLNLFARIPLFVAGYLIIPSDLKPFANQGLSNVKKFIQNIDNNRRRYKKEPIKILGILPSKISTNPKFVKYTLPERIRRVREVYGIEVMDTRIYQREILAQCTEQIEIVDEQEIPNPKSVLDFGKNSQSAGEFEALADEVMKKTGIAQ